MTMILACLRLPYIGWALGRAGVLGHIAQIDLLPLAATTPAADQLADCRACRSS